jgi:glutamate-1-semialdehyde 2,1-aminomutase
MDLLNPDADPVKKVKFEGGTFSAHPLSMLAGLTFLKFLIKHEKEIYPEIGRLGHIVRKEIEALFKQYGIPVKCTGGGGPNSIQSSLIGVHFLKEGLDELTSPEQVWNPEICDFDLSDKIFKLAMLDEGFNIFHGYGAISYAHTEEEIFASLDAVERIAKKLSS